MNIFSKFSKTLDSKVFMTHIIRKNTGKKIRLFPELFIIKMSEDTFVRFVSDQSLDPECKRNGSFFDQLYIELGSNKNFVTVFIVKERASFSSKRAHAFSWRARAEGHLRRYHIQEVSLICPKIVLKLLPTGCLKLNKGRKDSKVIVPGLVNIPFRLQ